MPRRRRRGSGSFFTWLVIAVALIVGIASTSTSPSQDQTGSSSSSQTALQQKMGSVIRSVTGQLSSDTSSSGTSGQSNTSAQSSAELAKLSYGGQQIIQVNQGKPTFTHTELSTAKGPWQSYHDLDSSNRVTGADALLAKSLMPTADRERLYVDPTGWHNKRVTYQGETDWLYNRSHLIGYQLTGQNNNPKNLMTGTRSLNAPGMEQYESQVASYLKSHPSDYVRYQVTPVFRGSELLARGVHMQARSIGSTLISFNIYIFNVQSGAKIDYATGRSTVSR